MDLTRPTYRIIANSEDITATIAQRFVSIEVTDEAGMQSDSVRLVLADHDPQDAIELPPTGAELEVWLGYGDENERLGLYVVDEIQLAGPPRSMTISAKAQPQTESKGGKSSLLTAKTRPWSDGTTLGDMVRTVASEHGLQPAIAAALDGTALPHVDQVNESDINLLTRLAQNYDAIVKPAGGNLVLAKRGESKSTGGESMPELAILPGMVTRWGVTISKRAPFAQVVAQYRDKASASDVTVTAGTGEPVKRLRHTYTTEAEADAAAKAEYSRGQRGEATLSLTMPGDPSVQAEGRLALSGFRSGVDGTWLITRVTHSMASNGYFMGVEAEAV